MADSQTEPVAPDVVRAGPAAALPAVRGEVEPNYIVEQLDLDYTRMLQKYRERSQFVDGVRKDALSKTKPHQWLARKDTKGNVTFNLMGPGAERIKTNCPIGFLNKTRREEKWNKESGAGYTIYFEAEVYLADPRMGTLPVIGSCSSDDDFFSTEHTEAPYNAENPEHSLALESGEGRLSNDSKTIYFRRQVPASEVTKENIEKSALTNLVVNGVTRVLGIRSIAIEELRENGIDVDKIPSINYGSGRGQSGQLAPADEQKRTSIWKMLVEISNGDEKAAAAALKKRTAFNDYAGVDDVSKLTEKQIARHYGAVKKDYDEFKGDGGGAQPPAKPQAAPGGTGAKAAPAGGQQPKQGQKPGGELL